MNLIVVSAAPASRNATSAETRRRTSRYGAQEFVDPRRALRLVTHVVQRYHHPGPLGRVRLGARHRLARLQTTRGYVAVFDEDVVWHYQLHLTRRRQLRPNDEYHGAIETECQEFEEHFDKRKVDRVELGACGRPYGTSCTHEHACVRCPMLHVEPRMVPRLDEIEADLNARRDRAESEGWRGEIEGIEVTLNHLRSKRDRAQRIGPIAPVTLPMPVVRGQSSD